MYYMVNKRHGEHFGMKVVLILGGLLLGAGIGLYVAALTMPLPHDYTPVYIVK